MEEGVVLFLIVAGFFMGAVLGHSLKKESLHKELIERGHMKMVCVGTECTAEWVEGKE